MTRSVVELKQRKRLVKKGFSPEVVEKKVAEYMKEYDLKEHYREIYLAGKSSYEKAEANAYFEIEWSKRRKELLSE